MYDAKVRAINRTCGGAGNCFEMPPAHRQVFFKWMLVYRPHLGRHLARVFPSTGETPAPHKRYTYLEIVLGERQKKKKIQKGLLTMVRLYL